MQTVIWLLFYSNKLCFYWAPPKNEHWIWNKKGTYNKFQPLNKWYSCVDRNSSLSLHWFKNDCIWIFAEQSVTKKCWWEIFFMVCNYSQVTGYAELTGFFGLVSMDWFIPRVVFFCKKWVGRIDFLHPNMPVIVFSVVLTRCPMCKTSSVQKAA